MSELSHHFYLLQFFVIIGLLPLSLSPPQPITSQKVRSWSGEQILTFFKKLILAPPITGKNWQLYQSELAVFSSNNNQNIILTCQMKKKITR
jgi:hypothetical protein